MLIRERIIEEVKDAGLDWQRGFVVSDDSNRYEDLCHAIEALVRAECVPQWRDIETAPKDGRKVMLSYTNRCGNQRTVLACWLTEEQANDSDADGVGLEAGWYECIDNWPDYTEVAIHEGEPTHWMPPPAAPGITAPQAKD